MDKTKILPPVFVDRLRLILPPQEQAAVLSHFSSPSVVSVRINTLKKSRGECLAALKDRGVRFQEVPWWPLALIIDPVSVDQITASGYFEQGWLYRQSLSSMLPVLALGPQPGERVLDMCAAPGSKTTQIAALMEGRGTIVAVEAVRSRFYKLKSVAAALGAGNIIFCCLDARRFRSKDALFDKILVDVPCSCETRFKFSDPKTFAFWSPRKIKDMVRKQRGLLLAASRLLNPGGSLVYATCTFAPEENEGVVDWLLRKTASVWDIDPIRFPGVETTPALTRWENREFDARVANCCRVLPTETMEGFFMVKLTRSG
ncbi:MAG: RsmB/NOP family class I SAM-dependent RNA methyltransferase [Candidatus Omnitrophota bacterium]|jgi:16S rRNA (cytosine1407-C5)-methyltransferase